MSDYYSHIDPTRTFSESSWILSIIRSPNPLSEEHAFIVVEGLKEGQFFAWFTDFVQQTGTQQLRGTLAKGLIRFEEYAGKAQNNLIYTCDLTLMSLEKGGEIYAKSWSINPTQAEQLREAIQQEKPQPPDYLLMGREHSSQQKGEKSLGSRERHNCFTWARKHINAVLPEEAEKIPVGVLDWIYSQTSRYLPGIQNRYSWYQQPKVIAGMVAVGTAIGTATGYYFKNYNLR